MRTIKTYESWFRTKPLGNIEKAKEDSLDSIREFLRQYSGLANVDGLSQEQLLELIERFAKQAKYSKPNQLASDIWRIAKPLFR